MKIKYCILQGLFWMLFCVSGSFITAYLVGIGVGEAVVGMVTAGFCATSALVTPILGRRADRGGRWEWNRQLKVMYGIAILCYVGLFIQSNHLASCILFGIILLIQNSAMPFVNGAAFYYEDRGIPMNFGVARGIGSLSFAVLSFFLGKIVAGYGVKSIALTGVAMALAMVAVLQLFPSLYKNGEKMTTGLENPQESSNNTGLSLVEFSKKYPRFMGTLVGFSFLLMFHNITNTYLLQMIERVGGGSEELGIALSIAAVLELPVMFGFSALVKKWKVNQLLMLSAVMFLLKGVAYVFGANVMHLYLVQLIQPFSYAIFASASVYYSQVIIDEENKLRGQSLVGSSITFGAVFGNLIGGMVLQGFSVGPMLYVGTGIAAIGAMIVVIFARNN